jgi:hypothetical protein
VGYRVRQNHTSGELTRVIDWSDRDTTPPSGFERTLLQLLDTINDLAKAHDRSPVSDPSTPTDRLVTTYQRPGSISGPEVSAARKYQRPGTEMQLQYGVRLRWWMELGPLAFSWMGEMRGLGPARQAST